jgi:hypothetical protein
MRLKTWVPIIVVTITVIGTIIGLWLQTRHQISEELDTFIVQGVVTDTDGKPVVGALVEIDGLSARTDASGEYVIHNVPRGTKTIVVHAPGAEVAKSNIRISGSDEIVRSNIVLPLAPSAMIRITYPSDGSEVERKVTVRGTSQNIPDGQVMWIVIYVHEARRYFPQDLPVDVQANGDWISPVIIGIDEDVGMRFDIIVVLVDEKAQDAFNDYLKQWKGKDSSPGLERLPDGVVIYERITVTRT